MMNACAHSGCRGMFGQRLTRTREGRRQVQRLAYIVRRVRIKLNSYFEYLQMFRQHIYLTTYHVLSQKQVTN